jgi:nitronate monooxygenase
MPLPEPLRGLRVPVVGAPLFIVSTPELVIAQCKAGVVGAFPALNAREAPGAPPMLEAWLERITQALAEHDRAHPDRPAAPFAVNQIVHRSNARLQRDVEICARWKVPIWITSMGARVDVNDAAHGAGALVLHDVTTDAYARKAVDKGADGLIAVAAGAGGHAGVVSPFALTAEIRGWFDGPLLLSGAIATGDAVLAAQALGADLAYVGSPFIATEEAQVDPAYKAMIVAASASDVMTTDHFTGHSANYLRDSIRRAGLDPDSLDPAHASRIDLAADRDGPQPWRDIWGAGQGVGAVKAVTSVRALVDRLAAEYAAARARLALGAA